MYRLTKEQHSAKGTTRTFRYALVRRCQAKLNTLLGTFFLCHFGEFSNCHTGCWCLGLFPPSCFIHSDNTFCICFFLLRLIVFDAVSPLGLRDSFSAKLPHLLANGIFLGKTSYKYVQQRKEWTKQNSLRLLRLPLQYIASITSHKRS